MNTLEQTFNELPPELKSEVEDFARFLLSGYTPQPRRKADFKWEGSLSDMKSEYSSVDLQHKILKIRAGQE